MSAGVCPSTMMSSRRLDFTDDARSDLRSILRYSRRIWGAHQGGVYAEHVDAAMQELTRFPELGRYRDDLTPGLRSREVQQHVVFCWVDDRAITVIRVLHGKMDASAHLSP